MWNSAQVWSNVFVWLCLIFVISLADPNHMVFVQFPDVMPGVPASYGNEEDAKSSNKDQVWQNW